jgi:replicative DNA helicase
MSRDIEKRSTGPVLADLRESGAIEQDADIVSFLYHPEPDSLNKNDEISGQEIKNSMTNQQNEIDIQFIIAKHRNGATDDIWLRFRSQYAKFQNEDDAIPSDELNGVFRSKMNNISDNKTYIESPDGMSLVDNNSNDYPF